MKFPDGIIRKPSGSRNSIFLVGICASFCLLAPFSSLLFAAVTPDGGPRAAVVRTGPIPGVRFSSGSTVCDEELRNGRWVSRYWESTGQIVADIQMDGERQQMDAAEKPGKWSVRQQCLKFAKSTARQPIDVGAELDLVLHGRRRRPLLAIYLPTRCFRSRLFS